MTLGFFLSTHTIDGWLESYGYLVVFLLVMAESIGLPVPGETALIGAALYAGSTHKLEIAWVIAVAIAGAIVWATTFGVAYYVFGSALQKLSTTIDVTLGVAGIAVLVGFLVWSKRKEDELLERAEREVPGSVAEELGEDEPAT